MHVSVMTREVLELLAVKPDGVYLDGTVGDGGHSLSLAKVLKTGGRLLALDRDEAAVQRARIRLADCVASVQVMHGNFAEMQEIARTAGIPAVDGILLDLGVSSPQLDEPARGFSFRADGPLDMRMDQQNGASAADLVNGLPEEELARIFYEFGEERASRRVARAIVARRKSGRIEGTLEFAGLVERAVGGRHGRIHPATRVFQALRIAVNGELDCLARGLEAGLAMLRPGGRMAVISFHSLEDRIVKRGFLSHVPATNKEAMTPHVRKLTKKPVMPSVEECEQNPRARSAKLRVVEVI